MDFRWTDEQLQLRDSLIAFARRELNHDLSRRDHGAALPRNLWAKCAQFGVLGLAVASEFGGQGLDVLSTILALEALGYGCRDNGLLFALNAQMWAVQTPILRFGSVAQKRRYLPGLVSGEIVGAHGMTEPGTGSDAFALATTAEHRGDAYVLNGRKTFVSNAPDADLFVVFGTLNREWGYLGLTAFLVERGTPGLSVAAPIAKMGLKTAPMADVVLDDCRIPAEQRLGGEGNGAAVFNHSMSWERCLILACAVGTMQRQVEQTVAYAQERRQFGKPLAAFQAVSHQVVEMKVRLEAARLLLYRAGWLHDQGQGDEADAAIAKLVISEAFVQTSLAAVQIRGGYGYSAEFDAERELRDAIGGRIYSGTSEIQREIIARSLGL